MLIFLTILAVIITIFLYDHFTKYNDHWKKRNVPGPKPTFFFGNIRDQALGKKATSEIYLDICKHYPEEKIVGIFRMRTPQLLIKDPDIVKHILIKDFDIFIERGVTLDVGKLGANLFHATTDTWRVLRSKFTPLFTSGKLRNMTYLMDAVGDRFLEYLNKLVEVQSEHDMHRIAKMFTQSSIAACAFGIDIDSFDGEQAELLYRIDQHIINNTYRNELEMMYPGILKKIGLSLFPNEVKTFFGDWTKKVIALRNGEPIARDDFIDLLLALRKAERVSIPKREFYDADQHVLDVTDDVIAAQSFIFFFAGNETSASTVAYILRELALHPEIQDKVEAEVKQVLQKHGRKCTYDAIEDLRYLDKVFHETLRLYLVAETVRRCPKVDYKIPGTDVVINKGQIILIPLNILHKDPKHFPNPEVFDPERFSPENIAARHSCAYMPFGQGPRKCIGLRFARLQTKMGVAKILSKFRVEPSRNTPREIKYVPRRLSQVPVGGFPLNLIRRELY